MAPRLSILICLTLTWSGVSGVLFAQTPGNSISVSQIKARDSIAYQLFLSQPDSSVAIAKKTLSQSKEIGNKSLEALSYYILSKAYWAKANYSLSAEYGFKALKILEGGRDVVLWGKTLLSVARTFIDLHHLSHGKLYIERAIALADKHNNDILRAEAYREKSMLLSEMKLFDSALHYADAGIRLYGQAGDTLNMSILFGRKAKVYFNLKKYTESKYYNNLSLKYDSLVGNKRALGISYYQAGLDAAYLGNIDSAIILLRKSIPINRQIRNPSIQVKVHTLLAEIYKNKGNPLQAYKELEIAGRYKDSLYNAERSGQIQEMHSLYELTSKEERIQQLAQDNLLQLKTLKEQKYFVAFLSVGLLLLGVVVYFLVRYRRLQERTNIELARKNRDIEQQKEEIESQAETLQQLNELKLKLFSVISHDLRGPMASLHALLHLLAKKQMTEEEFSTICNKLRKNVDVTQRTLENLLNWSLSQMEGIKADRRVISINQNIQEACKLMDETAQHKNIAIESDLKGELMVTADPHQVQLILRNLIHNAIKFSNPSERILVSTSKVDRQCLVVIKDHGVGMSPDELKALVDTNQHFSKTGTHHERGTGLGLLLCREFIKLNGGSIDISSEVNSGTEIKFTLPLAAN